MEVLDGCVPDGIAFSVSFASWFVANESPSVLYIFIIKDANTIHGEAESLVEGFKSELVPYIVQFERNSVTELES